MVLAAAVLPLVVVQPDAHKDRRGDDLTPIIAARNQQMWQAYKNNDAAAHNALLAADYFAIHPDGSMQAGPPSAEAIASAPIAAFRFSELKVMSLGNDAALATYLADVDTPPGTQPARVKFAAGTVWVKRQGEWQCRFYQGTVVSSSDR